MLAWVMNLGFAASGDTSAPAVTANKTLASPKSAGSLKTRG